MSLPDRTLSKLATAISTINRMLKYDKTLVQILRIRSISDFHEKCNFTGSH